MPRQMRVEYPGAMYHVMSRGDQRDDIFLDDVDRHEFVKTLAEACQKTDWWGVQQDTPVSREEFEHRMVERRRLEEVAPEALETFRSGRCLGAEAFRKECLKLILGKPKGAKSNLHKWMKGPPDDASQPKLDLE